MRFKNTIQFAKNLLLGTALIASTSGATFASDLRENLSVESAVIRLSDIFTDTGANGETIVMASPAPGKRTPLSVYQLSKLAETHKLDWERPTYLKRVYIEREGIAFKTTDLHSLVLEQLRNAGVDNDINVKVHGRTRGLYLPTQATVDDIFFEDFEVNENITRFTAIMILPTGTEERSEMRISGSIEEVRMVPMLNTVVGPGEIITKEKIKWVRYPVRRINANTVQASTELIGNTVRRALQTGKALTQNDIRAPITIAKGTDVIMRIKTGALTLTAEGRAMEDGGIGDTIRVTNSKTHTSLSAKVIHAGLVEVQSNSTKLVASR